MCLIALAWNAHPRYALVLAANRDEFHARPAAPLAAWADAPNVLGGRDLKDGGGWLALDAARGRLAAVTNVREPLPAPAPRSRGALVRGFVTGADTAADFADAVTADGRAYGGYNLLLREGDELVYATNRPAPAWRRIDPGVYGLSNGRFDAPWPKACRLTAALRGWLAGLGDTPSADVELPAIEPLFAALADESLAPDAELPITGVGVDIERRLSPPFIRGRDYGTRAASVVLIGHDGRSVFIERSFGPDGVRGETRVRRQNGDG